MVNFRPYILQATVLGDTVYDQTTGEYSTPTSTPTFVECNVMPNGGGKSTRTEDGSSVVYAYLIHANVDCQKLPYGTDVEVWDGSDLKAKGKVINQFSNSKNTRIWI